MYDNSTGHRACASDALIMTANSLLVGDISWAKEVPQLQPSRKSWYLRVRDGKRICNCKRTIDGTATRKMVCSEKGWKRSSKQGRRKGRCYPPAPGQEPLFHLY